MTMKHTFAVIVVMFGLFLVVCAQSGCGLAASEVGHRVGKTLVEKTVPVVKTTYLCDLPTLTRLVFDEVSTSVERSAVALTTTLVTDEPLAKQLEVKTLKGSVMTIALKETTVQEMKVAEMKVTVETKEEGVLMWKREDVSQRGPFLDIVKAIRSRVSEAGIKIVSDTVSSPLL